MSGIFAGESPRTTLAMDNRFVSEDFDTDSEADAENNTDTKEVDTSKIQLMTLEYVLFVAYIRILCI